MNRSPTSRSRPASAPASSTTGSLPGVTGTAGEIGHTAVAEDGPLCRCGNRGCLELYAGGSAVLETLRGSNPGIDTVEELVDLALEGDQACKRGIADAGSGIGIAVAGLVNLLGRR